MEPHGESSKLPLKCLTYCPSPCFSCARDTWKLVKLYPSAWHLVVLVDEKARGEKWARARAQDLNGHRARQEGDLSYGTPYGPVRSERRQEGEARHAPAEETYNATQASGSDFDPGAAIRRRTTKEKRQAKKQRIRADNDKEDLKAFRATAAGKGKQEGKGDKNGRLKSKDQAGGDLCFSRDSAKGPCKYCSPGEGCKGKIKRFHKCRICLSRGHRSQDCPQRAWAFESTVHGLTPSLPPSLPHSLSRSLSLSLSRRFPPFSLLNLSSRDCRQLCSKASFYRRQVW